MPRKAAGGPGAVRKGGRGGADGADPGAIRQRARGPTDRAPADRAIRGRAAAAAAGRRPGPGRAEESSSAGQPGASAQGRVSPYGAF